jgi:hypothetical protein
LPSDNLYRLVIASTDPDWYRFLRSRPELGEVNFWRPGVASMSMAKGTPWLFLIRGTSEIWGCGFFSTFDFMPIGVAWDTFGKATDSTSLRHSWPKLQGFGESASTP